MFGGLSGSVVQFTTQAAEYTWERYQVNTIYKWGRYEIETVSTYQVDTLSEEQYYTYGAGTYRSSYTFDRYTGLFTLTGSVFDGTNLSNGYSGYCTMSRGSLGRYNLNGNASNVSQIKYIRRYGSTTSVFTADTLLAKQSGTEDRKGSYIDDVSSTSSSAYPSNGVFGSYWYVSSGSETSRGNYIDIVSSADYNAYPDDGIQSGYWYTRK